MSGIFISYRREDAQWPAARIFDRLARHYDPNELFMDVDGLLYGVDFVEEIGRRVGECDALIAVIGKTWTSMLDKEGRRRLDDPKDFVRIEIESALQRDIRVIPVLIDGAGMPRPADLPFAMKSFSQRHAIEVLHSTFSSDMDRLCKQLPLSTRRNRKQHDSRRENGNAHEDLGGYSRESVCEIEGRYLTLRPSFSLPASIFAYCTEIRWDAELCQLGFYDLERPDKAFAHSGQVSAPHQSDAIYLLTNLGGKMRLSLLGRPTIDGEMFGVLTTLKPERGNRFAPAACPIALIPNDKVLVPPASYGRLEPGTPEYIYAASVLERVVDDGYATFLKPPKASLPEPVRRLRTAVRKGTAALPGQIVA